MESKIGPNGVEILPKDQNPSKLLKVSNILAVSTPISAIKASFSVLFALYSNKHQKAFRVFFRYLQFPADNVGFE